MMSVVHFITERKLLYEALHLVTNMYTTAKCLFQWLIYLSFLEQAFMPYFVPIYMVTKAIPINNIDGNCYIKS